MHMATSYPAPQIQVSKKQDGIRNRKAEVVGVKYKGAEGRGKERRK